MLVRCIFTSTNDENERRKVYADVLLPMDKLPSKGDKVEYRIECTKEIKTVKNYYYDLNYEKVSTIRIELE